MRRFLGAGRARRRLPVLLVAAALVLSAVPSVSAGSPVHASRGHVVPMVGVRPHYVKASKTPQAQLFNCQKRVIDDPSGNPACYGPQQIQAAYGITPLLNHGLNGRGRTIVIIDAFDNPYVANDLATFDQTFGLPDPSFTKIEMPGTPAFDITDDNMVGWSGEISLDVQWAHAAAPGAAIILVEAASNNDADILAATKYAVDHNLGDVISQSFGEAETCVDPKLLNAEHRLFKRAVDRGMTLIASSGDQGAAQPTCDGSSYILSASSPASDPLVTGVGGTTLTADNNTGAYGSERAWSDAFSGTADGFCFPPSDGGCSGGGVSTLYSRPDFQDSLRRLVGHGRGVPDVAYNAGVDGGVLTHWGVGNALFGLDPVDPNVFFIFGGTSAGSPQWAGLTAIADQLGHHRLGNINDNLYAIASFNRLYNGSFHDVTSGNNTWMFTPDGVNITTIDGFQTRRGWDAVTGLGTPQANVLVPLLAFSGH